MHTHSHTDTYHGIATTIKHASGFFFFLQLLPLCICTVYSVIRQWLLPPPLLVLPDKRLHSWLVSFQVRKCTEEWWWARLPRTHTEHHNVCLCVSNRFSFSSSTFVFSFPSFLLIYLLCCCCRCCSCCCCRCCRCPHLLSLVRHHHIVTAPPPIVLLHRNPKWVSSRSICYRTRVVGAHQSIDLSPPTQTWETCCKGKTDRRMDGRTGWQDLATCPIRARRSKKKIHRYFLIDV